MITLESIILDLNKTIVSFLPLVLCQMFIIASERAFIDRNFVAHEIERNYFETCSKIESSVFPVFQVYFPSLFHF